MKQFFIIICLLFCSFQNAFAYADYQYNGKPKVAVITDVNHRAGTIYLVTGASSDIIASDIITALNESGMVAAPVLGDSMQKITGNLNLFTTTFFKEYKYNYNVDFVNLRRVTKELDADYLLMVTSGLDVQSNFLKDTWWNKLNIPGMDPVKPSYRLTTLLTLVDLNREAVMWQQLYKKDISANNYDIGLVQFSPSYAQLSKIKTYSKRVAEHVTPIVNVKINPALAPAKVQRAVEIRKKDITEDRRLYYPVIHTERFKQQMQEKRRERENIREREYQRQRPQMNESELYRKQREPFIEDVNNFTPHQKPQAQEKPVYDYEEDATNPQAVEEKPHLKPAVQVQKREIKQQKSPEKQEKPIYDWNLKNIYENQPQDKKSSFWKRNKPRQEYVETVFL